MHAKRMMIVTDLRIKPSCHVAVANCMIIAMVAKDTGWTMFSKFNYSLSSNSPALNRMMEMRRKVMFTAGRSSSINRVLRRERQTNKLMLIMADITKIATTIIMS